MQANSLDWKPETQARRDERDRNNDIGRCRALLDPSLTSRRLTPEEAIDVLTWVSTLERGPLVRELHDKLVEMYEQLVGGEPDSVEVQAWRRRQRQSRDDY